MNKEKIVLSIIAIILGLFVAGGAFYIYQMTRTINEPETTSQITPSIAATNLPQNSNFLVLDEPKDEQVYNKKIISIKGKTSPEATVIVSTQSTDEVVTSAKNGDFTLTQTLADGLNILKVTVIFKNGEEESITRTVTSTTEDF